MKLFASTPVEMLREQVRLQATKDARFNRSDDPKQLGNCWVRDMLAPDADGNWRAIINATDGKLFEVPFTIEAGVVKLGATSREVFTSIRYLPLAAKHVKPGELGVALSARDFSSDIAIDQPWMFAPGGTHTIVCGAGEGSAEVTLRIDRETAVILNAKLAEINQRNAPQKAYVDKEHDEAAGATTWPKQLFWSDTPAPGVYLAHEPTEFGKELVGGKIIRAFSPSFYSDAELPRKVNKGQHVKVTAGKRGSAENPAHMSGLVFPAIGTLTNNPAFRKILPLWAKNAAGARSS